MWFRLEDGNILNLDDVRRTEVAGGNGQEVNYLIYRNGNIDRVSEQDRIDIEKLLMNRHMLKYKEIRE